MTYKEIYDIAMPMAKRKEERLNIWVTIAVRPLSVLLIKPLINSKVKPTTITKISVLASLVGFFLLASELFGLLIRLSKYLICISAD